MMLKGRARIIALVAIGLSYPPLPVEGRLQARSLGLDDVDLSSVEAFTPKFLPPFLIDGSSSSSSNNNGDENAPDTTCPTIPPDADCTLEYEPVTCNGCPYPNGCLASAALVGVDAIGCLGSPLAIDENGEGTYGELGLSNHPDCPALGDDAADCSVEFVPLECMTEAGHSCIYFSSCTAESAGFEPDNNCQPAEEEGDGGGSSTSVEDEPPPECNYPPSDTDCTLEYEPVTCNGCPYPNYCISEAALEGVEYVACLASPLSIDENGEGTYGELGLSNDPDCPKPNNEAADCTIDFEPLKCDGCIYINACAAESANLMPDECVPL
jgi:hypothetical protein